MTYPSMSTMKLVALAISVATIVFLISTPANSGFEASSAEAQTIDSAPVSPIITENTQITHSTTIISHGDCSHYAQIIAKYDWPVETALRICGAESGGNPEAIGDVGTPHVSCGLMQIRTLPGRPSCATLQDPEKNVEYAYGIWAKQGFYPWSTYIDKK